MDPIPLTPILNRFVKDISAKAEFSGADGDVAERERANVAIMQKMYRAIIAGDLDRFQKFLTDDIEYAWYGPAEHPFTGTVIGREAVLKKVVSNYSWLDDQRPQIRIAIVQPTLVSLHAHETGKIRKTGRPYEVDFVQLFRFRGDRICQFESYCESTALMTALLEAGAGSGIATGQER
ncbi:nuclear transport factor 2 family protein [Stratiformator vulcanicus]|uniref:SnoaL-like domain protein n=1 Tax=Stratiformator vulcanicus TaxID=2527980 RepID=A0A517R1R6_9PLAN|nr:nuclear transport factor 2 family protein [Stratiformator vulcanicus]QDT37810.1 SnoaL-like domain protein [Stratiformator vulcanicus]